MQFRYIYLSNYNSNTKLLNTQIIGDFGYNFIDYEGKSVDCDWNRRVLNLNLREIKKIPHVVCIAAGNHKVKPIYAALKARLFDTLITDHQTAEKILNISKNNLNEL